MRLFPMQRTGVQLGSREGTLRNSIRDFAVRAEALGFDTVWVGESWGHEAFTLLSHMAAVTERIRLGTGIVNVFSRSPALVAQTIASLDELSEGRAILGLGTSGANVVVQWHGIPYRRPVERMKEYVELVRLILRGERLEYHSGLFDLSRGFRLPFQPFRPDVPIYLATLAGRSLRLTGELADGWLPIYFWPERFDELTAPMRAGAQAAGRDFTEITVAPYILTAVSEDGEEARALMRAHIAYYIGGMGVYYHKLWHTYGFPEEADAVRAAWAAGDRSGAAQGVTDAMVRAVTISGTREQCLQRLEEYRAYGVQAPVLSMPHGVSPRMARETLEVLAPSRNA